MPETAAGQGMGSEHIPYSPDRKLTNFTTVVTGKSQA